MDILFKVSISSVFDNYAERSYVILIPKMVMTVQRQNYNIICHLDYPVELFC